MAKKFNMVGMVINGMEVLSQKNLPNYKYELEMKCHCGNLFYADKYRIKYKKIESCGCLPVIRKKKPIKHGGSHTKIYRVFKGMLNRCNNVNQKSYKKYGEKGVRVCDEWSGEDGFVKFRKWAFENGYEEGKGLSIDRIDFKGNYEPENCRIADYKTQNRNRSNTWYEYYNGEKRLVVELCEELGVSYGLVSNRKYKGCSGEELFK